MDLTSPAADTVTAMDGISMTYPWNYQTLQRRRRHPNGRDLDAINASSLSSMHYLPSTLRTSDEAGLSCAPRDLPRQQHAVFAVDYRNGGHQTPYLRNFNNLHAHHQEHEYHQAGTHPIRRSESGSAGPPMTTIGGGSRVSLSTLSLAAENIRQAVERRSCAEFRWLTKGAAVNGGGHRGDGGLGSCGGGGSAVTIGTVGSTSMLGGNGCLVGRRPASIVSATGCCLQVCACTVFVFVMITSCSRRDISRYL